MAHWASPFVVLICLLAFAPSAFGAAPTNASWSADPGLPRTNQTITFSGFASDADDDIATYAWNWGDGNSTAADPSSQQTHSYTSAGTYVVRLTVTDATANSVTYENTIVVRANWGPTGVSASADDNAAANPKTGVSNTYDFYGYDQEQPGVDNLQWHIDWGDGSTTDPTAAPDFTTQVTHSYANPGTYLVHYSATDQDTATHKTVYGVPLTITVAAHPGPVNVGWSTDVNPATTGQSVTFTGYAQDPNTGGGISKYEWDWNDDGTYDNTSNDDPLNPGTSQISHTFAQPGTYAVTLRATNNDGGTSTYTYSFYVTSPANGPIGYLSSDNGSGYYGYAIKAGQAINFYADTYSLPNGVSATGYVFHWDDGTANTSTASFTTQHTYASPGLYRPYVVITLSNSQTLTVQYTSYVFDPTSTYGTYIYEQLRVLDNAPPAYAYGYVTNDTGCLHPNVSIGFTLVGFDPDGGHIATFDVDWNGDGTFEQSNVSAVNDQATVNHTFTTDGHYVVIVRAHDDDSPTKAYTDVYDAQQVDITPDNCPPYGYVTHSPDQPQTGHTISFNASYSYDLDGTVSTYQWDWNQDGTYDSTGATPTHSFASDGDHYYTLKLTDNQGGVSYYQDVVTTHTGNHLPNFYDLYISDITPDTAETVYFDASGYDDDGNIATYTFHWGDGTSDTVSSSSSVSHKYTTPGTYHPTVTLTDNDGGSVSSSPGNTYTVTVTAAIPQATVYWSPDEPHPGTSIAFSAVGSSPNGAINQYVWHWGDGTADTTTTVPNANHAYATAGTFPVTVTVRDTTNATGTGPAQNVKVMTNWPPHAYFTSSPQCTTTNTSITFDATGTTDSDSVVSSYHWDFGDGTTADTSGATTTHAFANEGTYDVTLVAKDAGNASSIAYDREITVQSGNCPPQDVYFTYSPQSLPSGSPISFTGHGVDPDGTITSYTWSWGDGTSDTISPTSGGTTTQHTFASPGLYTVQVIARDNQGLAGIAYSLQIVVGVDTTPPTVTLTTPADGSRTNDTTPTYSGTAGNDVNDSTSVTVKIYSGSTVSGSPVQTRVATRSGTGWTIVGSPALAEGTYTAQAQQSDNNSNTGFSAPHTFVVDTTAPTVTLTSPANGSSTKDTTPTLSGAAGNATGDSSTVTVKIYSGSNTSGTLLQTMTPTRTGATWTVDAAALPEGTYTAQATQTDSATNTGTSSANTFTVDTTAPSVTLTTPANGSSTKDTTPTLSGAAGNATGDSSTVTVKIYSGSNTSGTLLQTMTPTRTGATWTVDAAALGEGTYTAQATQTDAATNTGTSSANTFTIDTTAPTVTLTAPANSSTSADNTPTYSGAAGNATGDSASVTVKIYSGANTSGTLVQTRVATRSAATWTIDGSPALADGQYTAEATQIDAAGNTGTSSANTFTINGPPVVTITSPADGSVTKDNTPAITGSRGTAAGDLQTVTLKIYSGTSTGGTLVQTLTDPGSGSSWQVTAATLADGTYTAQAEQSDASLTGMSSPVTFRVDATAPTVTVTAPANGSSTTDTTPTISGTGGTATGDDGTVTVKIYSGGSASGSPAQMATPTLSGGNWTFDATTLAVGTYTVQASQGDSAGNTGTSAAVTFTITSPAPPPAENHAPTCTDTSKTVPNATATAVTLSCSDPDGDALTLSIAGSPAHGSLSSVSGGSVTYTPSGTYSGSDSFTFKASDGKADSNTATATLTVQQPPPAVIGKQLKLPPPGIVKVVLKGGTPSSANFGTGICPPACFIVIQLFPAGQAGGRAAAAKPYGSAKITVPPGKTVPIKVKLTKAAQKKFKKAGKLKVTVVMKITDAAGQTTTIKRNYTLKKK